MMFAVGILIFAYYKRGLSAANWTLRQLVH